MIRPNGLDSTTKFLMHGDTSRGLLDFSGDRTALTTANLSLSNAITPRYGGTESALYTTPGYTRWSSKKRTGTYSSPFTIDFFIYFATTLTTTNQQVFGGEITNYTTPSNGDWWIAWYHGDAYLRTFSGSRQTCYRGIWQPGDFTSGKWWHVFFQVNADGTHTYGRCDMSSAISAAVYNATPGTSTGLPPTLAGYGFGPTATGYESGNASNVYIQEARLLNGVAAFPATGTYYVPLRPYG